MRLLYLVATILLCQGLHSQPLNRVYPNNIVDDACVDYDGGLLMLTSTDSNFNIARLIKLDANGNILWRKVLKGTSNYSSLLGMTKTADGGTILTGYTSQYAPDTTATCSIVLKLDACGNVLWSHIYPTNDQGDTRICRELPNHNILIHSWGLVPLLSYGSLILLTPDGKYIRQFTTQQYTTDILVNDTEILTSGYGWWVVDSFGGADHFTSAMKFDHNLNLKWENVWDYRNQILDGRSCGITRIKNDTIITFNAQFADLQIPGTSNLYILKRLPDGSLFKPQYIIDTIPQDANPMDAVPVNDSEFLVYFHTQYPQDLSSQTSKIFRMTANGIVLDTFNYRTQYGTPYNNGHAVRLLKKADKFYAFNSYFNENGKNRGTRLTCFDEHLNILNQDPVTRIYDSLCSGTMNLDSFFQDIDPLTDTIPIRLLEDSVYNPYPKYFTSVLRLPESFEHLQLYPNPVSDILHLSIPEKYQGLQASYYIYDPLGHISKQQKVSSIEDIDVSQLSAGHWFIKVYIKNMVFTGRFVKMNR